MDSKDQEKKEISFRRKILTIIEILTDITDVSDLQEHLPHLHCDGWDEVIEERFVNKQCGFPACSRDPPKKTRTQMFQIDKKEGKIYEFCKQRSKFCSEKCYQKNLFVRKQLDEHPLWITGMNDVRMNKKYEVPDESFVSPVPEKSEPEEDKEPSIEFVSDSIIAKVQNLKLNEEYEEPKVIDSDEPEKEPYKLTEEDKDFIKSIRKFKTANFGPSPVAKPTQKTVKPKLSEKNQQKENEILAKLREKYGNKNAKQKKPPIMIDAPQFHPKETAEPTENIRTTTVEEKYKWLIDLIKSWFTEETRKLAREGPRSRGGDVEQVLMDFLSGKKIDTEKLVDLPNLDKYNVKEKRLNIFLHSVRHHWADLEARLHLTPTRRDLLSRVATTFHLNAENITGWNKKELNIIVIALFILVCFVDVELGDDYFKKENPSPELSAVSTDLCGIDSYELTGLHDVIKSQCANDYSVYA
ncbi:hypothetical protein CRE_12156 [Caenorhabditis remanei]|uniref:RNA polymerase II subunit B1 CTD phosphatase RPAP2 homolog n=1 Tax=Caenorhabditis remanei TaxID=31234 RepID=E3N083_CAERE|nr:hypothetical protein CRE_12156 [Caenorhabditis remanei]